MDIHDRASEISDEGDKELINLFDFLQSSPLAEALADAVELDLERPVEFGRDFTFEDEELDG